VPQRWFALAAILLVGTWFRLRLLSEIPADMGWDLPYNYYDALTILNGQRPIFFPANLGREGLFFYCIASCARVLGLSQWTLHLTSALIGTITVVALYSLGREAFNGQVGLLAAWLLAVNRWHIILSRSGYRVILMPLFTILVLYTLARALRTQRCLDFAWAGIAYGLGFYTYKSFVFVTLAISIGLLLYLFAHRWSHVRSLLPGLLLMACMAVVTLAPLGRFAVEHPEQYFAREQRQLEVMRRTEQLQAPDLLAYYWRGLLGFNFKGDGNARFNVPGARHMGFVSGTLMVLGLSYLLLRWRHGYNVFLLSTWFVLILPTAATMLPGELPNIFRMSGTIGPALILAALPLVLIFRQICDAMSRHHTAPAIEDASKQSTGLKLSLTVKSAMRQYSWDWMPHQINVARLVVIVALTLLLAYEMLETNRFCFDDYVAVLPDQANYSIAREMAREMEHYGNLDSAYIKVWPHWFDGNAVKVSLRRTDRSWNCEVSALSPDHVPLSTIQGPVLFILHPHDQDALTTLRDFFPRGVLIPRHFPDGTISFLVFYGER
jgi:4-amino-4-deoxy-L-arabinose transferase-like glycosyltransferase